MRRTCEHGRRERRRHRRPRQLPRPGRLRPAVHRHEARRARRRRRLPARRARRLRPCRRLGDHATSSRTARCTTPSSTTRHRPTRSRAAVTHVRRQPAITRPAGHRQRHRACRGRARADVPFEGFADRGYTADGTLIPRSQPGALLTDGDAAASAGGRPSPIVASPRSACTATHPAPRSSPRPSLPALLAERASNCGPSPDEVAAVRARRGARRVRLAGRGDGGRAMHLRAADLPASTTSSRRRAPCSCTIATSTAPPWSSCWCRSSTCPDRDGSRRRDPRRLRRRRPRRGRRRRPAWRSTRSSTLHSSARVLGGVPRFHPGWAYLVGLPSAAAPAAATDTTHVGARRLGRHRQRVQRRVPDDQPRGLAPARAHHDDDVRRRRATSRRWSSPATASDSCPT